MEMGRQAVSNATHKPDLNEPSQQSNDKNASQANPSQHATKQLKMTLDEAHLILNVKREASLDDIQHNYDHLFKMNSPPQPKVDPKAEAQPKKPQRRSHLNKVKPDTQPYSHYLQSKVVRAFERIQAEQSSRIETEKTEDVPGTDQNANQDAQSSEKAQNTESSDKTEKKD